MGHVADYRDVGYLLDIGPGFNPELEEVAQVEESHRNRNAQNQGDQVVHFAVGRYRSAACHRRIDDASVVGGSGKGDGVFLTLLQQHQVEVRLDFLLARDAHQFAFLLGGAADARFVAFRLTVEVGLGDEEPFLHALYRGLHIDAHGTDAGIQCLHRRVIFGRSAEQALAFDQHLVVVVDGAAQSLVA